MGAGGLPPHPTGILRGRSPNKDTFELHVGATGGFGRSVGCAAAPGQVAPVFAGAF